MGLPVLICGRTSTGKSYSMRRYNEFTHGLGIISVQKTKMLPFRSPDMKVFYSDNYDEINIALLHSKTKSMVIDDAGYLITHQFMRGHRGGKGNAVYELYNDIADNFWSLITYIGTELPHDKIVYFTMHEDTNDLGETEPKTIGKLLNEKISIPGMLSVVFQSVKTDSGYKFMTQSNGKGIAKTPEGMFDSDEIDNDLKIVDDTIREYYGLAPDKENTNEQ